MLARWRGSKYTCRQSGERFGCMEQQRLQDSRTLAVIRSIRNTYFLFVVVVITATTSSSEQEA